LQREQQLPVPAARKFAAAAASKQASKQQSSHKTAVVYGATRTLKFCTAEPSALTANSRGKTPTRFLRRDPPPEVICRQQHAASALVMV